MKIKTFGARCTWCQIDRIESGLRKSGCEIVEHGFDLVYANNPPYDDAIAEADFHDKPLILNVLDIPEHLLPNFDIEKLNYQLKFANAVTCISKTVAQQVKKYCNINAHVIYQPAKNIIYQEGLKLPGEILYAGRACDANKRYCLIKEAFADKSSIINVAGPENPLFGGYHGIVTDEELSYLYNCSEVVLLPSRFEGLGLTAIEGIWAKCYPILCKDNPTAVELYPEIFLSDPHPVCIRNKYDDIMTNRSKYDDALNSIRPDFMIRFHQDIIAKNILGVYYSYV